jgi:excisionase family DNA binding protein
MSKISSVEASIPSTNPQWLIGNTAKVSGSTNPENDATQYRPQSLYPLFENMLRTMGLALKATYTCQDVATLFGVTARTIQCKVADGTLPSRKLIGRGRFLPKDLEDYLRDAGRATE